MKTAVCLSEYKKLGTFERKMIKFLNGKDWLMATLPIINILVIFFSAWQNTAWYYVLFLVIFFFSGCIWAERYGKLSVEIRPEFNEREAVKKWAKKFIHGK